MESKLIQAISLREPCIMKQYSRYKCLFGKGPLATAVHPLQRKEIQCASFCRSNKPFIQHPFSNLLFERGETALIFIMINQVLILVGLAGEEKVFTRAKNRKYLKYEP